MYALMIVPSDFPNGDAGAVRDMAFAKIYQKLGYQVFLIGMGKNVPKGNIDGIKFFSLYRKKDNKIQHIIEYVLYKKRLVSLLDRIVEKKEKPDLIHINDISSSAIGWLIQYCKGNSIPILHDSTEWYSECEFKRGKRDKAYILKDRLNRKVIRDPIKVIGISSYLENHFRSRKLESVRVPVIMDVRNSEKSVRHSDDMVRLIYAGSPAAKDHLKEIVEAVIKLPLEKQKRLFIHILGVDKEKLKELCSVGDIPGCVRAYGRVPREQVMEVMLNMDFSCLLRPSQERYTMAGFPTKSVEAMSHRVAMLCNLTSDLGMYLQDGENAIVVKDCSTEAFSRAINRVLDLTRDEIERIKDNARLQAEKFFDYRLYVRIIKQLIEK